MENKINTNTQSSPVFDKVFFRWAAPTLFVLSLAISLSSIKDSMREINTTKKEQLKVQQAQLDVAKRQYSLDSLKFYSKER